MTQRLTKDDALTFWRARDTHRFQVCLSYVWLLLLFGGMAFQRWWDVLGLLGFTAVGIWGWPWLRRKWRRGRVTRHLPLVCLVLAQLLTAVGCQSIMDTTLRTVGCDEVAMQAGYCHMPKEVKR